MHGHGVWHASIRVGNANINILWVHMTDSDDGMATCLTVDCSSIPTGERGTHWSTREYVYSINVICFIWGELNVT